MVKVKIISGPRAGQENLVEIKPEDLIFLAQEGLRWEVDWDTIASEEEVFAWVRQDVACKIISCLIGGRQVILRFPQEMDYVWSEDFSADLAQEIEDAVVNSGYNVFVAEDSDKQLVIKGDYTELPVQ